MMLHQDIYERMTTSIDHTRVVLDWTQSQVKKMLLQVKHVVNDQLFDLKPPQAANFSLDIGEMMEVYTTMYHIYGHIEELRMINNIVEYINKGQAIGQYIKNQYSHDLTRFKAQFVKWIVKFASSRAFYGWGIPFTCQDGPNSMANPQQSTIISQTSDFENMLQRANQTIASMLYFMKWGSREENGIGRDLLSVPIDSGDQLYLWKNEGQVGKKIDSILRLERAYLYADVTQDNNTRNHVIKLKEVEIKFIAQSQQDQAKLDSILDNFLLRISHSGNSYYKFKDKIYVMSHQRLDLEHTFRRLNEGGKRRPLENSAIYSGLRKSDPIFSPFTYWDIQLQWIKVGALKREEAERQLAEFANKKVDIRLIGEGFYVMSRSDSCAHNLTFDKSDD